jgi:copper homeostasis protein
LKYFKITESFHWMICEVCVDSADSIVSAIESKVNRIELCSSLNEGGLTPTIGLTKLAKTLISKTSIQFFVMIRPRAFDFLYSDLEFETMKEDIKNLKDFCDGFVFGILTKEGSIDLTRTKELIQLSRPKGVTFHRAFDMTSDLKSSLLNLIELRVDRVLTSGGETNVDLGMNLISQLQEISKEKIIIMPGSGVNIDNIEKLKSIGIKEFHLSGRKEKRKSLMQFKNEKCDMGNEVYLLNTLIVKEIVNIIQK